MDRRTHRTLLAGLLLAAAAHAWLRRFVLDDAFISLRYARHLVEGHGLVWNPGEPVEGYTNFLWTVLLAAPLALGRDPVSFVFALGPLLLAGTLAAAAWLAVGTTGSRPGSLAVVLALGSSFTFASFATGGLETGLLAALVTTLFALAAAPLRDGGIGPGRGAALSLLAAAALMTRLDAGPVCAVPMLWLVLRTWREARPNRATVLAALLAPAALALGAWAVWKLATYGALLPNTFAAKTGTGGALGRGLRYLDTFLVSTWLLPLPPLIAFAAWRARRVMPADVGALLLALVLAWLGIVAVGGDFMEFRFLVPTLPLFAVASLWAATRSLPGRAAPAALLVLVLAGGVHHGLRFERTGGIESIPELAGHLERPRTDWIGIGRQLAETLPAGSDLRIAVVPAGAIPYFAGLPSLDMLGLTDPWIARHGLEIDQLAGHTRIAPFAHLLERDVDLVIGLPWVRPRPSPEGQAYRYDQLARLYLFGVRPDLIPAEAGMLEIPLDPDRRLVALELRRHPDAEAAVAGGAWRRVPLRRPSR